MIVNAFEPKEVIVDGKPTLPSNQPIQRQPGWWWDEKRRCLYISAHHEKELIVVAIR
ncbi:MAG: hypothetical protein NZ805_14080 [Armatimonadetes bacterium]|nr:hypothetical protein [Armatimonadota bacterium]MDW8028523.1 hypothetical protein [Armatimonadota bacterium]